MKRIKMWFTPLELEILEQGFADIEDDPESTLPDRILEQKNLTPRLKSIRQKLDKAMGG